MKQLTIDKAKHMIRNNINVLKKSFDLKLYITTANLNYRMVKFQQLDCSEFDLELKELIIKGD
jgi:hypothetical protein